MRSRGSSHGGRRWSSWPRSIGTPRKRVRRKRKTTPRLRSEVAKGSSRRVWPTELHGGSLTRQEPEAAALLGVAVPKVAPSERRRLSPLQQLALTGKRRSREAHAEGRRVERRPLWACVQPLGCPTNGGIPFSSALVDPQPRSRSRIEIASC